MSTKAQILKIENDSPISTWFRIGGRARQLALPESVEQLIECLGIDPDLKVLGEGANLLVDDDGLTDLVVSMQTDGFKSVDIDAANGIVTAGAGTPLPRLITQTVNQGLSGLQGLAGFPATIGGAVIMNAGGRFGTISDHLVEVQALDRAGRMHAIKRSEIDFSYRRSGLNHLIITSATFQLPHADTRSLKAELAECMHYKTDSQPMSAKSAGCAFKNPSIKQPIDGIPETNQADTNGVRVSAGMLIDRAGCKSMSSGGARVSEIHANFITTSPDAKARDVITLMELVEQRVFDTFGVKLDPEVVIWSQSKEQR
ncbi:MAG: UDP-N-acetylmuramate dehydrogenase [Phycisphaerales bacterium]